MKLATPLSDVLPSEALSGADEVPATLGRPPAAVARPATTDEVVATLGWASAAGVGVVPCGSGRRLRVGRLDHPYLVLRTDRLSGIEIYEAADLTLTAGAGTPVATIGERLLEHAQWLPFDPPHVDSRSLGGLVATGESGPMWMGYGELRNHVLGMTVVTGDGRVLRIGGRVVKNVAGFDLLKPMVGSRGRLAVITSVCVRAFPRPAEDRVLVLRGAHPDDLFDVARAVGTAPVLPVSSVLVAGAKSLAGSAALLVRLHGAPATVEADHQTLERHCGVEFARPEDARTLVLEARDAASEGPAIVLSVLPARLGEALAAVRSGLAGDEAEVELVADTYLGRIRVGAGTTDPGRLAGVADALGRLGGAVAMQLPSGGEPPWGAAGAPESDALADLVAGLVRVFDPTDTLWPCRR